MYLNSVTRPYFRLNPVPNISSCGNYVGRVKRIWYLSPMRAAKVQASLRMRAVSPEPPLLAHTSSESRGTLRQIARSLAPLNGWTCPVKICHDGMLEDTNSLDAAHVLSLLQALISVELRKRMQVQFWQTKFGVYCQNLNSLTD